MGEDFNLQGISTLFDDSVSTENLYQKGLLHTDNPSALPKSKFSPLPVGEVEGGKLNNCIVNVECPNSKAVVTGENNEEWKEVQPLLTEMGLQMIQDSKKTNLARNGTNVRRKRVSREVQNLDFNVNYDRCDCSRGKRLLP